MLVPGIVLLPQLQPYTGFVSFACDGGGKSLIGECHCGDWIGLELIGLDLSFYLDRFIVLRGVFHRKERFGCVTNEDKIDVEL